MKKISFRSFFSFIALLAIYASPAYTEQIEDASIATKNISLLILIDTSGSMKGTKLDSAKNAAVQALNLKKTQFALIIA